MLAFFSHKHDIINMIKYNIKWISARKVKSFKGQKLSFAIFGKIYQSFISIFNSSGREYGTASLPIHIKSCK